MRSFMRPRPPAGVEPPPHADHGVLAALGAFARAGFKPATPLQKAIALALAIKLVAVIAMRLYVSLGDIRVATAPDILQDRILGKPAAAAPIH